MATDADDIALLYAWRQGDREAGDQLMRRYYPQVMAFFFLRGPEAAEDLTQRTFLACTEARDRVESSSFRAYMFGVARRMLIKHIDSNRRIEEIANFGAPQPQSVLTPSGVVNLRQEQWLLMRALERVPTDMQVLLALFYVQGLRAREIADVLEMPTSTVTTRLQRAREALRDQVQALKAPAATRDALISDLESWTRSLGPIHGVVSESS